MSERIILDKSFNPNKPKKFELYVVEGKLCVDDLNSGMQKSMQIDEIVRLDVINSKCPAPFKRYFPLTFEVAMAVSFVFALIYRKNPILLAVFACSALVFLLASSIIAKVFYSKAPEAVEITAYTTSQKIRVLGCKTSAREYNGVIRIAKECKKLNKKIALVMETKK